MERLTKNKRKMLEALYEAAPEAMYGLEISQQTKIASGALYPALRSLRKAELVKTEWRTPEDDPDGQPLRYYELSANGFALVQGLRDGKVTGTGWRDFLPASLRWSGP